MSLLYVRPPAGIGWSKTRQNSPLRTISMSLLTASRSTSSGLGPFAAKIRFLAGVPTPPVVLSKQRRQIIQKHGGDIELADHATHKGHQTGKFPARGVFLDDVALRVLVVSRLTIGLRP